MNAEVTFDAFLSRFAPDILTNSQWRDRNGAGESPYQPERNLHLAMIELALRDFASTPRFRAGVREWVEDQPGNPPFSLNASCEFLGIDPDYLRTGLREFMNQIESGIKRRPMKRRTPATSNMKASPHNWRGGPGAFGPRKKIA